MQPTKENGISFSFGVRFETVRKIPKQFRRVSRLHPNANERKSGTWK